MSNENETGAAPAPERTTVTLIQTATGVVKRVRVGEAEFVVLNAAPMPGVGVMNLIVTLADVDVRFEVEKPAA